MAYSEDIKRVFQGGAGLGGGSEIYLLDRSVVVLSGHKGLLSLSPEEVVVRLKEGVVVLSGEELRVQKISPTEVYLQGRVLSLSFPREEGR